MTYDYEEDEGDYNFPDSYRYPAVGTLVGMIAVFLMVVFGFIFPPEVSSMDLSQPIDQYNILAGIYGTQISFLLVLDTVFIVGYLSLFVGLWMLIRDFSAGLSKVGLGLGLLVGLFDLVENAIQITLIQSITNGYTPEPGMYGLVFALNTFIDILSYAAGLIFAIIFLTVFRPWGRKFVLGLLLAIYVLIGLVSLVFPAVLLVRSLFFVIGLIYGGIILWTEEEIPEEILHELVKREEESKNDFIR